MLLLIFSCQNLLCVSTIARMLFLNCFLTFCSYEAIVNPSDPDSPLKFYFFHSGLLTSYKAELAVIRYIEHTPKDFVHALNMVINI